MSDQDSFTARDWLRLLATIAWLCIFVVWPRLTLGITFILVGGLFIAYNAMIFWETVIRRGGAPSPAPLVGGLCAAMGIFFLPIDNAWLWALIPLGIDYGGILPMLASVITAMKKSDEA
jgi:hypothetical protein